MDLDHFKVLNRFLLRREEVTECCPAGCWAFTVSVWAQWAPAATAVLTCTHHEREDGGKTENLALSHDDDDVPATRRSSLVLCATKLITLARKTFQLT